jgi:hypothetical protein
MGAVVVGENAGFVWSRASKVDVTVGIIVQIGVGSFFH